MQYAKAIQRAAREFVLKAHKRMHVLYFCNIHIDTSSGKLPTILKIGYLLL